MPTRKSQHASITLVLYLALLIFASLVDASAHPHLNHKRLLKKRAFQLLGPPDPISPPASQSSSTSDTLRPTTNTATPTLAPIIIGHNNTSSGPSTPTSPVLSPSLPSNAATSSPTTSGTDDHVTSTPVSTPSSPPVSPSSSSSSTPFSPTGAKTFTQTQTYTSPSSAATVPPQGTGNVSDGKKTMTMVIIILAASVGGVTILWTLFRKWKLGRSSRFDERLQPIDWQPPTEGEGRQRRPTSMEISFPGAAHAAHGSDHGHVASSDHGHGDRLTPLPEHDFTPLPANPFAAVGSYADLARGHTPQPHMQEAYGIHHPVMTGPAYDVNVPLHHQAGYGGHDGYDYTQYHGEPMKY